MATSSAAIAGQQMSTMSSHSDGQARGAGSTVAIAATMTASATSGQSSAATANRRARSPAITSTVTTAAEKALALKTAKATDGVKSVVDHLKVAKK